MEPDDLEIPDEEIPEFNFPDTSWKDSLSDIQSLDTFSLSDWIG